MSDWEPGGEPTHAIPPDLVAKLTDAKEWLDDRRNQVAEGFSDSRAWMESDVKATELLTEIVVIIENTWGFAQPLERGE